MTISEYAIIEKDLKKVATSMLQKASFSFLCTETYKSEKITDSIARGMNDLVAAIRTDNMFPIEPYATRIAESVKVLFDSADDNSVELFFDDVDLVAINKEPNVTASAKQ